MSDNELANMQREWRESTSDAIRDTAVKVDLVLAQMAEMRRDFATAAQLNALAGRVSGLEGDRQRIIGGAFVLNLIGGLVLYLLVKLWK